MNQRIDVEKQTLVDFNPDTFRTAITSKTPESTTPTNAGAAGAASGNAVSKGRVTPRLSDLAQMEVKTPASNTMRVEPTSPAHMEPIAAMETETIPRHIEQPTASMPEATAIVPQQYTPPPLPEEGVYIPPSLPTEPLGPNGEYPPPVGGDNLVLEKPTTTTPRSEAAAALHVQAIKQPKPKKELSPNDMITMNLRITRYLKDSFFKRCKEKGMTPSRALRSLLESFCGL